MICLFKILLNKDQRKKKYNKEKIVQYNLCENLPN